MVTKATFHLRKGPDKAERLPDNGACPKGDVCGVKPALVCTPKHMH